MKEVLSYTIPGYESVTVEGFADIDSDGMPEILVRNQDHLMVYNQSVDSIIFETDMRSYETKDFEIEFADLSGDAVPELAIAYAVGRHQGQDTLFIVDVIDIVSSANNFSYYPPKPECSFYGFLAGDTISSIMLFKAIDVDKDSGSELLLTYKYQFPYSPAYDILVAIAPYSILFDDFPESIIWSYSGSNTMPSIILQYRMQNLILAQHTYEERMRHGIDFILSKTCTRIYDESCIEYNTFCVETGYSESFLCSDVTMQQKGFGVLCYGNLDPSTDNNEILVNYSFHIQCMPDYYTLDTSLYEQRLYTIINHDSLELVSTFPMTNHFPYLYDPNFPGYYFAFNIIHNVGRILYQYDAISGQKVDSTSSFPRGSRSWWCPFGDDRPCFVGTNDSVIRVYQISKIPTSADGDGEMPVPDILYLGNPYPNPFNNSQTIPVYAAAGRVLTVNVYNLLGQKVDCIYQGKPARSGEFNINWQPGEIPSGIYFIKATSGEETRFTRSILLK